MSLVLLGNELLYLSHWALVMCALWIIIKLLFCLSDMQAYHGHI